jgi:bifunctional non-homologous end joining protein LigD
VSAHDQLEVGGRQLTVSNLDKVLYPAAGFTKAQVIDYYVRIAPMLLPHLRDRPLTLKRYPQGVLGGHFYEKRCPAHRPSWVRTVPVWSERKKENVDYCLVGDLPSLVWAANLADLELHTSLSRARDVELPTAVVFDLDPGAPADLVDCCRVALMLRAVCERFGLVAFPKTSGGKGLQVYLPVNRKTNYDQTKSFSHALAESLEQADPAHIVSKMRKSLRTGKVFIDWSQNDRHKTTVCAYSLRAMATPTVSTPVTWDEVEKLAAHGRASDLIFSPAEALARVKRLGDLFAPVETLKQKLP